MGTRSSVGEEFFVDPHPWGRQEAAASASVHVQFSMRELGLDLPELEVRRAARWGLADSHADIVSSALRALDKRRHNRVKRCLDIVVVVITAPLWLPLLLLVALAVKCTSRGPAFYAQERLGRYGRPFRCVKIRTMVVDAERRLEQVLASDPVLRSEFELAFKLRRDPRVTRLGRVLRKTGLDELPQILSVLTGRMSVVGPRPIVPAEKRLYGPYLPLMLRVRPGLTGLWQVSGRNDISYSTRIACDVKYVITRSLWRDVWIIVKTALLLFQPGRRGSY